MRDVLREAQAADVRAGRRWRGVWAWVRKWGKRIKFAAEVAGAVGAIFALGAKAWLLLKAREVGRPELPANGVASTAVDRVERPPDGGK